MKSSNSRKRSSPTSVSDLSILPAKKALLDESSNTRDFLTNLPSSVITNILEHLDLDDLVSLSLTSHRMSMAALAFFMSLENVSNTFPFLIRVESFDDVVPKQSQQFLSVLGEPFLVNTFEAKKSFSRLGIAFKRMTVLMTSKSRMGLACDFLSRLEVDLVADLAMVQSRQLAAWCAVFYHNLIRGWENTEIYCATEVLINHVRKHKLEDILEDSFVLGSCPGTEIFYKHFFSYNFYKEVSPDQQSLMLQFLLWWTCGLGDHAKMAKVLLLMATPSKEDIGHWKFGIQWNDHTEAIPASLAVASSRYSKLVSLVRLVAASPVLVTRVPDILHSVFTTPGPWLPENVASVLLLLGPQVTAVYLKSLCEGCVTCLNKAVTSAIVGLSVMTLRFRWSFDNLSFSMFQDVLVWVPADLRESLVRAVWAGFSAEVSDLRLAASHGEDWAAEGGQYLYSAIQRMGALMMNKAFCLQPRNIEP